MRSDRIIAAVCVTAMAATLLTGCGETGTPAAINFSEPLNENEIPYMFTETETYENHLELEDQWGQTQYSSDGEYGIGDPFVMRYDGKYYMYPSSAEGNGEEQGVKVFESEDLIRWTYQGMAATGSEVESAYAPEVVYYNGNFYMTESQAGSGHYILTSDSPTGPFTTVAGNFGRNIDGSFYVGDDGQLYFLYPANNVIQIAPMDLDTMTPGIETALSATLNGWTEGPGLFRRNGILYLTYTGNSVVSQGYRVGYSYSMGENPAGSYVLPDNNLILLHAGEDYSGLGHSSNVIGPNLDSWYTAYHNLLGAAGPQRRLMIDQLVTNGALLMANGPTYREVSAPDRPDFETRGLAGLAEQETDGQTVYLSSDQTAEIYTIEYNVTPEADSLLDFIFGYEDGKNYTAVRWDVAAGSLTLVNAEDGKESELGTADVAALTHGKLHTLRVEKGADQVIVYVDSMKKLEADIMGVIAAGYIGVSGEAEYSYIAFTNDAFGTSDFETVKNLPCSFAAVHYLKGENRGFSIANAEVVTGGDSSE